MNSVDNIGLKDGFDLSTFLSTLAFLGVLVAIIGIPLVLILIFSLRRSKLNVLFGLLFAVFTGLVSPLLWLSWTKNWGIGLTFQYGPLPDYSLWQLIGFGLTVTVFIALITWKYADHLLWVPAVAVFSGAGFTVAFCASNSFEFTFGKHADTLISFIGSALVALPIALLVWLLAFMIGRKKVTFQG